MYPTFKLRKWDIKKHMQVCHILYECGKDMAEKYDLHHWDNSYFKNCIILLLCAMKNDIYLVYDNGKAVATFQTAKKGEQYLFQKLATLPKFGGKGIGSFCLEKIEELAAEEQCKLVICDVYDKSSHALEFYLNRGYTVYAEAETLKYRELKLRKEL